MEMQREDMAGEFVNEDAARRHGRRVCEKTCSEKTWQEFFVNEDAARRHGRRVC